MTLRQAPGSRRSPTSSPPAKPTLSATHHARFSSRKSNISSNCTLQQPKPSTNHRLTAPASVSSTRRTATVFGYRPKRHLYRTSTAQKVRTLRRFRRLQEALLESETRAATAEAAVAASTQIGSWQAGFDCPSPSLAASSTAAGSTAGANRVERMSESDTFDTSVTHQQSPVSPGAGSVFNSAAAAGSGSSNAGDDAGEDTARSSRAEGGRGRNGPRSRNGCWTCRTKKVKCDEKRPKCLRCIRLRLLCDYEPRDKRQSLVAKAQSAGGLTPAAQAATTVSSSNGALVTSQPWLLNLPSWNESSSLPMQLSVVGNAACSLELTSHDHEAIRYYRTAFAKRQHTKNPDWSIYSVIFTLAERDPLVMRGLLALGGREIQYRRTGSHVVDKSPGSWTPLGHYSAALRMMADTIGTGEGNTYLDLDVVLAALHLMLLYELKYGDPECAGWMNHLTGAALIIQHRCRDWPAQVKKPPSGSPSMSNALVTASQSPPLSLFSARMLIYIATLDAAGSTYGLGGQVNRTMHAILHAHDPSASPVDSYLRLHHFSHSLFRTVWGESYPQAELIDDIENRGVFGLIGSCFQLRYLVAEIANLDGNDARQRVPIVQDAIEQVGEQHAELLAVATELSTQTDNSHRVTTNIRAFVPHYYAVLLEFHRMRRDAHVVDESTIDTDESTVASHISIIVNLATQTYKHQGLDGLMLVAFPLFVAALETDSQSHRDWVLARFQGMMSFGRNIERAHRFLTRALEMQAQLGYKIDVRKQFRFGDMELFVV